MHKNLLSEWLVEVGVPTTYAVAHSECYRPAFVDKRAKDRNISNILTAVRYACSQSLQCLVAKAIKIKETRNVSITFIHVTRDDGQAHKVSDARGS
jgi:hypothetical protein